MNPSAEGGVGAGCQFASALRGKTDALSPERKAAIMPRENGKEMEATSVSEPLRYRGGCLFVPRLVQGELLCEPLTFETLQLSGISDPERVFIHNHTTASPCAAQRVEDLLRHHEQGIYVTDHHVLVDLPQELLAGVELKTEFGEVQLLDINPEIPLPEKTWQGCLSFADSQPQAAVGLNHPFTSNLVPSVQVGRTGFTGKDFGLFHYVEVNTNNYRGADGIRAMELAAELGLPILVGEDTHFRGMLGTRGMNIRQKGLTVREALDGQRIIPALTEEGVEYLEGGFNWKTAWIRTRSGIRRARRKAVGRLVH